MQFQGCLVAYELTFYKTPQRTTENFERYTLYLLYIFSTVKLFIMMISTSVIPFNLYLPHTIKREKTNKLYNEIYCKTLIALTHYKWCEA